MKNVRVITILMLFAVAICFANRGMIPVNANVQIFEPTQRAMIAWDGFEEILLLSTDIQATDSTLLIEVLPLPAEPVVKKGDLATFQKATALINSRLRAAALSKKNGDEDTRVPTRSGEVTFHKKIGAHDISVTHLLEPENFIAWVKEYLHSREIEEDVISEEMESLIEDYIENDFVWFVFDVVTVGKETVTNQPIQYWFTTKKLFYPLKITSTAEGNTAIELLVLTPRLLQNFPELPMKRISLKHEPITITNKDLETINEDMFELLGNRMQMKLRIWEIKGELKSFDKDLIAF